MTTEETRLTEDLRRAERREYNDDHLTDSERARLVRRYREMYGETSLPSDTLEAFLTLMDLA